MGSHSWRHAKLHRSLKLAQKKKFEELQTNLGFNYYLEGVLNCPELLEITKGTMCDWAHVYLVSGSFGAERFIPKGHLAMHLPA